MSTYPRKVIAKTAAPSGYRPPQPAGARSYVPDSARPAPRYHGFATCCKHDGCGKEVPITQRLTGKNAGKFDAFCKECSWYALQPNTAEDLTKLFESTGGYLNGLVFYFDAPPNPSQASVSSAQAPTAESHRQRLRRSVIQSDSDQETQLPDQDSPRANVSTGHDQDIEYIVEEVVARLPAALEHCPLWQHLEERLKHLEELSNQTIRSVRK